MLSLMGSYLFVFFTISSVTAAFNLTILHMNDIHSRFEQINKYSGRCSDTDVSMGKCYGGTARLVTKVKERRALFPNSILVSAGDEFSGTLWYYKYGGEVVARFMNILKYDVMALGNHEFDNGIDGLMKLLNNVKFPVTSANIDASKEPRVALKLRKGHVTVDVGGQKIGLIGYTTRETPDISMPGSLLFNEEVASIQREVDTLTANGVNKIIAVGHSGFDVDQRIAANVIGLDIVVGGHTNTFLYTGNSPSNEKPAGDYPYIVTQKGGAKVLCVQDFAYGKYLGELQVTFNEEGVVTSWGGNPILLDNKTAQDEAILDIMQPYREGVANMSSSVIGKSHVLLEGDSETCRTQECNLGNFIADAMVHQNIKHSDSLEWNHVAIAIVNSGGIRSSIPRGDITVGDLLTVQPFRNTVDIVELKGKHIRESLEYAASRWTTTGNLFGGFLQISGMKVKYNMKKSKGGRVDSVEVRCTKCLVPRMQPLEEDTVYKVVVPAFLANGGDGYNMIRDNKIKHHNIGDLDSNVLIKYAQSHSPLTQGLEGRITFSDSVVEEIGCPRTNVGSSYVMSLFNVVLMSVFVIYCVIN